MSLEGGSDAGNRPRPQLVQGVGGRSASSSMTWRDAQSAGMIAAAQAHGDLGVNRSEPFVDVVSALANAGVRHLMWRPMSVLFGAYLKQHDAPIGVLVNNGLPFGARRMTAAHELGHHRFGHATSLDDEHTAGGAGGRPQGRWTDQEKLAESFAMWFLMPTRAVHAAGRLVAQGQPRPRTPDDAYQISLLLGVPYRTVLRHLPSVRLLSPAIGQEWAKIPPARLKTRVGDGFGPLSSGHADVFAVSDGLDDVTLTVKAGDRLVFDTPPTSAPGSLGSSWPDWLVTVGRTHTSTRVAFDVVSARAEDGREIPALASVHGAGTVHVRVAAHPHGLEQGGSLG